MFDDPIVNEIRSAREKIARECNHDIHQLFSFWREMEKEHPERLVVPNHYLAQPEIVSKNFPTT